MKINSLAEEYKQRQKRMDERLKKEIELNSVAKSTINVDGNQGST
jgi:hypothetical protein